MLALNMADVAAARGLRLNPEALAAALGAPVVVMSASKGQGLAELKATLRDLVAAAGHATRPSFKEVAR